MVFKLPSASYVTMPLSMFGPVERRRRHVAAGLGSNGNSAPPVNPVYRSDVPAAGRELARSATARSPGRSRERAPIDAGTNAFTARPQPYAIFGSPG